MSHRICAVLDIDDTLYLERDYVRSGFEAVGRWAAQWMGLRDFTEQCWTRFLAGRRGSIFDEVLRSFGRSVNPALTSALVEIYRTHIPSIQLISDASEAIDAISRTAAIAVVSDGPAASQSRKAEVLGLNLFATPIVLTGILGDEFRKPHTRAFEEIRECRPAGKYLYIADNPLKDFAGPKSLGWTTVRIRRPGGLHYAVENSEIRPDYEMSDCSKLPELLAEL
jgi:putative hydrolase of the HAD superfamily